MEPFLEKLKRYFIPHPGNDHKPHILRREAITFVILVALVAEFAFLFSTAYVVPASRLFGTILVNALVDGTNQNRVAGDLPALRENALLDVAAQEKANDMVKNGYFAHTSPTGITPWYWFADVGYNFTYAGENLAVDFTDSQDVTSAWMNSPEHRANILDANYTDIGMAIATGTFQGESATYVVELFGAPAVAPIALAAPKASAVNPAAVPTVIALSASQNASSVQTSIAVKGAAAQAQSPAMSVSKTPVAPQNNVLQNILSTPRQLADDFYLLIIGIFALALALTIFVKIRIQHPKLITSGVLVIAVAAICIVLNQHFMLLHAAIL